MDEYNILVDKTFFYPNCCHVCRKWDVPLISCARCRMISYCSEKHQQEHLCQHEEICGAIKLVLEGKEYMNTEEISTEVWTKIRTDYLDKVSVMLKRNLKYEEIEMFLYPKACVVCHRQDTVLRCYYCPSAAFCNKHRNESEHREKYCKFWRDCFEISDCLQLTEFIDISYVDSLSDNTSFYNMQSFLDTYLPLDKNSVYLRMLHSNKVTNALTVYYCIKKLDYLGCETLNIHIMGAHVIRIREDFEPWKMLLILIPTLTTLTITFIQVESAFSECDIPTEVLNVSETKKLVANMRYMLYEEFVGTTDFKKPNLIVGFHAAVVKNSNAGNGYVNISETSGAALAEQKCPCILIFEHIDRVDVEKLYQIEKLFFGINPFTDSMVHRHFVSERPYFPNNYLIIFSDLDSSKISIDKDNRCVLFVTTTRE